MAQTIAVTDAVKSLAEAEARFGLQRHTLGIASGTDLYDGK